MKSCILVLIFSCSVLSAAPASKGAVTEGRFILQNKIIKAKESIEDLKKELTQCFSQELSKQALLEVYHCKLRQLIYPAVIDELTLLIDRAEKESEHLSRDELIDKAVFDQYMKRAFLLADKIDLEKQLLKALFSVDNDLKEDAMLTIALKKEPKHELLLKKKEALKNMITRGKIHTSHLKSRVRDVNNQLFKGLAQEAFLDKLSFYA